MLLLPTFPMHSAVCDTMHWDEQHSSGGIKGENSIPIMMSCTTEWNCCVREESFVEYMTQAIHRKKRANKFGILWSFPMKFLAIFRRREFVGRFILDANAVRESLNAHSVRQKSLGL